MKLDESVYIVIPAYNEDKHIQKVLQNAKKFSKNIIVINDGSTDNTINLAREEGAIVLNNIINVGKGAALKTGCDYAYKEGAKKIIVMDADGQHDAKEIPNFVKKLDNSEIVFGFRNSPDKMPLVLRFGNWFINKTSSVLHKVNLKDTQCGFRAFQAEIYPKIRWRATDYFMESEMIARTGKYRIEHSEVPIETIYSDKYKGTTVIDGVKIVLKMLFWRVQ